MTNENVYEKITAAIVEQLEKGIIPWQKPWIMSQGCISHTNGRPYSMLNQWLLGNRVGEWLTFNQIKAEGGSIRKGEKASFVVFWKFLPKTETDENGEKVIVGRFPILKYYNVWHIEQCDGITEKYPIEERKDLEPISECENIVNGYIERECLSLTCDKDSDRAYYSPMFDSVTVPQKNQFGAIEQYYSTLFHELTHSTGHKSRLNRDGIVKFDKFGSEQYSKEELIAEIGAAFLCNTAGLDSEKAFNNSVAYLQSWLGALKNDKKLIVAAASKAEQAAKYILTGEKPKVVE